MNIFINDGYCNEKYNPNAIESDIRFEIGEEYDQKTLEEARCAILKVAKRYIKKAHRVYLTGGAK